MTTQPGPADLPAGTPPAGGSARLLSQAEAQRIAAEFNTWAGFLRFLGPVPLRFHVEAVVSQFVSRGKHEPTASVRLIAVQPTGPHVMFLSPDQAVELAGLLTNQARVARTGLVLPGSG